MKYNPLIHHRRSIRLRGYDYSRAGMYSLTLCVKDRRRLFGEIINCEMKLSDVGIIAEKCWEAIPKHFDNAALDEYVIMPDHMHGIIILRDGKSGGAQLVGVQYIGPRREAVDPCQRLNQYQKVVAGSISSIIRCYKAAVTRMCRRQGRGDFVWQRNYYEHIIRDGLDLDRIRKYIRANVENSLRGQRD